MGTLAWSTFEQQIRLDAELRNGRLIATGLATTRVNGLAEAMAGQDAADLPQLLSRIFPLCGMAHAVAGMRAIEAGLEVAVSPAQQTMRELMLLAEHAAAAGWRITMDWPPLLDQPPDIGGCTAIRRAVAAVGAAAHRERWTQIGGVRLRPAIEQLRTAAASLAGSLGELFPEAADPALSWKRLRHAIEAGSSLPARLIAAARVGALAEYGSHDGPLLQSKNAAWFSARLADDPGFGNAPALDGTPAEVGPLAARRHPLTAEAIAAWGPTLATRLLAAALDAVAIAARLADALDGIADDDPAQVDPTRCGRGTAVVETSRGPLAYLVDTADGKVRTMRSVAPTEWNFHPDGPFMAALRAAPRLGDPVRAARLLAASFDPCVPFTIKLADRMAAAATAETTLDA